MRNWKLFIVLCVSLLLMTRLPQTNVLGCAFSPYEVIRAHELAPAHLSFFPSDIGGDPRLVRYAFVTHPESLFANNDHAQSVESQRQVGIKETNIQEWRVFFNNQVSAQAIEELIYGSSLLQLEHARHRIVQGSPLPKQFNEMLNVIQATKQLQALDYVIFAKQCESYAVYDGDPWSFKENIEKQRNPYKMKRLMDQGTILYNQTSSPFLKMRYGYQIVRLAHYARRYAECIRYYDTLIAKSNVTSVYRYQAMRHKAASLKKLGRRADALVLISLVFDQSNPLMDEAYQEFFQPTPEEWELALQSNSNPHHQATLWLLRSLRERDRINLEPIKALYTLEPKSSRLETLLVRQINIIEKSLVDADVFHTGSLMNSEKAAYIQDFIVFLQRVDKTTLRQPKLWYLAEGYLHLLLKQYNTGLMAFDEAEKLKGANRITETATDLKLLAALSQAKKITPNLENLLLPTIQRFNAHNSEFNHATVTRSYLMIMAQKYFMNKQFAKGYGCISRTGYANLAESLLTASASPEDLDRMYLFITDNHKTAFDRWISQDLLLNGDDILAVRGTKLIQEERFKEALTRLTQISPDYWNDRMTLLATSFETSRYNARTGLYNYPVEGFSQFNKYTFIRRVVSLLDLAAKQPNVADQCYYQIANGFFHTAGWSYYDLRYNGVWFDRLDTNPKLPFYDDRLNLGLQTTDRFNPPWANRRLAWKYYDKALSVTKNKELAAQCAFLAAASQTRFARQDAFEPEGRGKSFYFNLLKSQFAETSYYRDVVQECSAFKDYLKNQ